MTTFLMYPRARLALVGTICYCTVLTLLVGSLLYIMLSVVHSYEHRFDLNQTHATRTAIARAFGSGYVNATARLKEPWDWDHCESHRMSDFLCFRCNHNSSSSSSSSSSSYHPPVLAPHELPETYEDVRAQSLHEAVHEVMETSVAAQWIFGNNSTHTHHTLRFQLLHLLMSTFVHLQIHIAYSCVCVVSGFVLVVMWYIAMRINPDQKQRGGGAGYSHKKNDDLVVHHPSHPDDPLMRPPVLPVAHAQMFQQQQQQQPQSLWGQRVREHVQVAQQQQQQPPPMYP